MIPGIQEIRQSCSACWGIMKGEGEAVQQFDLSVRGFWRSFAVIFLLAPLYYISLKSEQAGLLEEHMLQGGDVAHMTVAAGTYYLGKALALGVDWIAFPIIVGLLSTSVGLQRTYTPYIIVRNWSSLLILLPQTVLNLGYLSGLIPTPLLVMLTLPLIGWVLWYRYRIARVVGQCTLAASIGLVVLDLVLSLLISNSFDQMFGL